MNKHLYYDGTQIKNYLIGFASIFSEIPYRTRKGKIDVVPIYYGSPSDIISYLESNVDNEQTKNRNRIKDLTIPLFSFRLVSMERNLERRRAPLDSITVDLKSMGYNTGYVAMKPAPFRFIFELILWASSDYQAFEISEQILPYFNSPQQVTIEPLPKCPVSKTEINLESFEIDTEPDSQKYSAIVTMSFNLTGWLLSQPKIWSTNMKFELSMLDKKTESNSYDSNKYSFGHDIIDKNAAVHKTKKDETYESLKNFINKTELSKVYGEKFDWYSELVKANRISPETGQILNTEPLTIMYKGEEKVLYKETMELLIDDMEDVKYLFKNEKLKLSLSKHSIPELIHILYELQTDISDTIDIFLTLYDNNLVTADFNRTEVPISNSDKLNLFGTFRVDIDFALERLRVYLSSVENLKLHKEKLFMIGDFDEEYSIFIYDITIPLDKIPDDIKTLENKVIDYEKTDEYKIIGKEFDSDNNILKLKLQKNNISHVEKITTILYTTDKIIKNDIDIEQKYDNTFEIEFNIEPSKAVAFNIISDIENPGFNIKGIYIQKNNLPISDEDDLNVTKELERFNLFDIEYTINKNILFENNYFELFSPKRLINERIVNLNMYVITTLIYNKYKLQIEGYRDAENNDEAIKLSELLSSNRYSIFHNKFKKDANEIIEYRNNLLKTLTVTNKNKSKIDSNTQKAIAPDLAVKLSSDKNGNLIYDKNNDGYIDKEDLKLLGAEVDDPDKYDYEIHYGIWYKRFKPENMTEERINKVSENIKTLYFLTEKEDVSEIKDYLILNSKNLLSDDFNIFNDSNKIRELKALGYDIKELDDRILFLRLFENALRNILIDERDYLLYKIPDIREKNKRKLYKQEGIYINKITIGKFIERYFYLLKNKNEIIKDKKIFRKILTEPLGKYYQEAKFFNDIWSDIKQSQFFFDSLKVDTAYLDLRLPKIAEKIESIINNN